MLAVEEQIKGFLDGDCKMKLDIDAQMSCICKIQNGRPRLSHGEPMMNPRRNSVTFSDIGWSQTTKSMVKMLKLISKTT